MSMLTTKDLQQLLQVDRSTIYRMAEAGQLPAMKVGRQWRFPADRIDRWLEDRNMHPATTTRRPDLDLNGNSLSALLPSNYITSLGDLIGEMHGVMVVVTDMEGEPLAEPSNQCGLFKLVNEQPGAVRQCVAVWRDLAQDLDLAPRFAPSHLGLLCARSYLRVGSELRGIILAGGIAPSHWPPPAQEIERMSTEFGIDASLISGHVDEVFHLNLEAEQRVLALLPRLARFLSEVANERKQLFSKLDAIAALAGVTTS
ncbi:MAG: helix-turn-helix domain-containing protein [Acidimicrobiia bacterium]|nr:helix-turn-helix domain-containing protein [Acidimicrobiia bacterium]MDH3397098.1 helix-turn-helix domain-containing protein [Acidimicrobiia bacterium]